MPDDNQTKEGQEDLKKGEDQTSGDDQTGNDDNKGGDGNGDGDGEETVTLTKKELDKIKSDRDNYREGMLGKKAADRELKNQKDGDGDGNGDGGDGDGDGDGNTATINETRVTEIAKQEVSSFEKRTAESNQKRATKAFLKKHKEYIDDPLWNDLMTDFHLKGDEATPEDYLDRLGDALVLHKRRTGKLDEYLESERERGRQEGRIEAEAGSGRQAGGVGDRNEGTPTGKLSEKGKEIAKGVKVDPKEAEKVDPSKDNVIDMTQE